MRSTLLLLTLGLFGASAACAGNQATTTTTTAMTTTTAHPRPDAGTRSPGGRHIVAVARGGVYVDGHRVQPSGHAVQVLAAPTWRADGNAVAWTERGDGETRLVVVSQVGRGA